MRDALLRLLEEDTGYLSLMRSGLADLTDAEYLWEPVEDCWSVRPSSQLRTPPPPWKRSGDWGVDIAYPDPEPSPFTTIAWRMVHMIGSVRVATATIRGQRRQDGAIEDSDLEEPVPATAAGAVGQWESAVAQLRELVSSASPADFERQERQWWDEPGHTTPVWEHVMYFGYFEPASHGAEGPPPARSLQAHPWWHRDQAGRRPVIPTART